MVEISHFFSLYHKNIIYVPYMRPLKGPLGQSGCSCSQHGQQVVVCVLLRFGRPILAFLASGAKALRMREFCDEKMRNIDADPARFHARF